MSNYLKKVTKDPNTPQKRAVIELMMPYFTHLHKLVGLPGPFIESYIDRAIANAFEKIQLFEIDNEVMIHQIQQLKKKQLAGVTLTWGDINSIIPEEDTMYDLDYCGCITSMTEAVKKFKHNFIMTFSRRRVGNKTIDVFFSLRNEIVTLKEDLISPIKHSIYTTDKGKYIYAPYFDTSAMCCIAKIQ